MRLFIIRGDIKMKLIMEGWRDFLDKSGKKPKPEEKKEKEESSRDEKRRESVAKALARGGLTQKQAEEWLESGQSTVELEEAEELEEGFPEADPDYDYKERKASGRLPKTEPFPMPPGRTEAQDIYFGTGPESEDILAARKIYMKLEDGDPREEAAREALLGVIQQAVGDNEDLFAQVAAVMEEEERYAR